MLKDLAKRIARFTKFPQPIITATLSTSQYLNREASFYRFLIISAYVATLGFGVFYYLDGITPVYLTCFGAFGVFFILGILSLVNIGLPVLFRLSIFTTLIAFFVQIYFTGGTQSPAYPAFLIPPLLAFFYKPVRDRYFFMILSGACVISIFPLTLLGYTQSLVSESFQTVHGFICVVFVFGSVTIYTFLFRNALIQRNLSIGNSMKQLQDTTRKLIQSEKMASLGMLSAGVAHEINNPLNFIKGGVEILEQGLVAEKELRFEAVPCLNIIKEGLGRASVIVNSLNHFSRNTEAMDERCDVHEILNNSLIMLQPKLKYKGTLEKDFTEADLIIYGNEGKLHQAFLNIISNAEQAIEKNGKISVRTAKTANEIKVEIADNGVGISKENLLKISDPFFTTKPVGQGTGLGLSITYKIIEDHNGKVSVSSKPGKGSKFTMTFYME